MVDNGAGEANPCILVPSSTLKKIAITHKKEYEQDEVAGL
jgi:hypothetical protein